MDFNAKLKRVMEIAEEYGAQSNFFFQTTLKRYIVQINTLDALEKKIKEIGMTVEKEYVKGRMNVCINPTITEYNKTATAANNTVKTLVEIVKNLHDTEDNASGSNLKDIMKELMG